MTEAMPFLQKYDITFLRPPTIRSGRFFLYLRLPDAEKGGESRAPDRRGIQGGNNLFR